MIDESNTFTKGLLKVSCVVGHKGQAFSVVLLAYSLLITGTKYSGQTVGFNVFSARQVIVPFTNTWYYFLVNAKQMVK